MHKLAITVLAAVVATVGLAADASARDGRGGDDRYLSGGYYDGYRGYDGYYGGYRARRHWRRAHWGGYYGQHYVVRRDYYRGGGCMRRKYDAYGNVYYKIRRACR